LSYYYYYYLLSEVYLDIDRPSGQSRKVTRNGNIGQIIHDLLLVELFDVKYDRDLEIWVRGHSRSLKVVPFKSLGTVSYSSSIVNMAVSVAILEIFSLTLKSGFGVLQDH